ncbi:hypothetical protein BD560DRAFT_25105 [Blakeslea trispora]|nr:hypothetical protein BD560DRAFT_25105 [Blakeslea trispora]
MPKNTVSNHHSIPHPREELTNLQPMHNEDVENYLQVLFDKSSKGERATACMLEWFDFLQAFNIQKGYYILTQDELSELETYCTANEDLEMTPDEFIRLIHAIRDIPEGSINSYSPYPIQDTTTVYFHDRESTNHPDPNIPTTARHYTSPPLVSSASRLKSTMNQEHQLLSQSRQENEQLLSKYEKQMNSLSERIGLLESRLETAKLESSQQKAVIDNYKNKEKERQETIAHLRLLINNYETSQNQDQLKLAQKDNELHELQQQLHDIQTSHQTNLSCLEVAERDLYQAKEQMRQQEKQRLEHAEQTKQYDSEIQYLQQENSRLLGVIDKQKFDLDEARTARYVIDNTTHDQLKLDYEDKLNQTINQHRQITQTLENELAKDRINWINKFRVHCVKR